MMYFFIFLFLEVFVSSYFGDLLGFFLTFVWIILSIFIGVFILKNFNLVVMYNMNEIMQGNLSKEDFYKNNISKLIGALLLIVPGFFSDTVGIIFFTGILNNFFIKIFKSKNTKTDFKYNTNNKANKDNNIIDVEILE